MLNPVRKSSRSSAGEAAVNRDAILALVLVLDRREAGTGRAFIRQAQAIADYGDAGHRQAMTNLLDEVRVALDAPAND